MIEDEMESEIASGTVERVPFPPGRVGPRDYARISMALFRDARREFGFRPVLAVAAEAIALPLLLVALQSAVLAIASYFRLGGDPMVGIRGFEIALSLQAAGAIVLVAGSSSALVSYYGRTRINRMAVQYEAVCGQRSAKHFEDQASHGGLNLKEAVTLTRADARSCGAALRLLLLTLPWAIALILILPLLFLIQWVWTLALMVGTLVAGVVLLRLNRRMVQAAKQFDTLRDTTSLELTAWYKTLAKDPTPTVPSQRERWTSLNQRYLNVFEDRLQVPVRTQAVTGLLFALSLAAIVPAILFTESTRDLDVILFVFYIILLRVGFSYMGRVATLLMAFNQQFPMVRRHMLTIPREGKSDVASAP